MMNETPSKLEQFREAIKSQDLEWVQRLLESGVSPNVFVDVPRKLNAVGYAQSVQNDGLLALLITYGARTDTSVSSSSTSVPPIKKEETVIENPSAQKVDTADGSLRSRFISAVRSNNHKGLQVLLNNPEFKNINIFIDNIKNTALHHACLHRDLFMVNMLMSSQRSIYLHIQNANNLSPLDIAIEFENADILNVLSQHTDFRRIITTKFRDACDKNNIQKILFLTNQFSYLEFDKLKFSIECGDFESFTRIINSGIKPESSHVRQAMTIDDERFIELMLKNDKDFEIFEPRIRENRLLVLARQRKWAAVLAFITNHPICGLDPYGYTELLIEALKQTNETMVQALLAAKTPLHCLYSDEGATLLNTLRDANNETIISCLIQAAANDLNLLRYIKLNSTNIPPTLEAYFIDPIYATTIFDPVIVPQGTTYHRPSFERWLNGNLFDPQTMEPLSPRDLLPNQGVKALIEYYLFNDLEKTQDVLPLINPTTGYYYKDPVVATDGHTYERAEIIPYLRAHNNRLPLRSPGAAPVAQGQDQLYPNRLFKTIIEEIYLKREFLGYIETHNLDCIRRMIADGFSKETKLDNNNNRLTHLAILKNDMDLFNICLELGADFQAKNKKNLSAIQLTMQLEDKTFFGRILENFSINAPDELQKFFKEQVRRNNLPIVDYLLTHYKEQCRKILPEVINTLINIVDDSPDMLALILANEEDTDMLDHIDSLLLDIIKSKNCALLNVLLNTRVPMRSLMSIEGTTVLKDLATQPDDFVELIKLLLSASLRRKFAVSFHIKQILEPDELHDVTLSTELEDLLSDPIDLQLFENPYTTPTGQSFSYEQIQGKTENPVSREPLHDSQLRLNILLTDLIKFLRYNPAEAALFIPPMLMSSLTSKLMTEPVIGENGLTYDKAELEAYKASHEGRLPDQLTGEFYPDLTMKSLCDYYRKKHKPASVAEQGIFGSSSSSSQGSNTLPQKRDLQDNFIMSAN